MGNLFTDCYIFEQLAVSQYRFDCTHSTGCYPFFEDNLLNKQRFNIGGLSINYSPKPSHFKNNNEKCEMILGKGSSSISTIYIPNVKYNYIGYGDVKSTNDALILKFLKDHKVIEVYIARGLKFNKYNLYQECANSYLDSQLELIKRKARRIYGNED
jgi:hypothetical protein